MALISMGTIAEVRPTTHVVGAARVGPSPYLVGTHTEDEYVCGRCRAVLAKGISPGYYRYPAFAFLCDKCGSHNRMPEPTAEVTI